MRRTRPGLVALLLCLLVPPPGTARAQASRPASARAADLLRRCTSEADEVPCRAVLRLRLDPKQRSLALTYLAESGVEPRDTFLAEAIRLDATNALALYRRALSFYAPDPRAEAHLLAALALRPQWTQIHHILAARYDLQHREASDSAVRLWLRAVQAEPADPAVRLGLAAALFRLRRLAEAQAAYREVLSENPDLPRAVSGLCFVLLRQKQLAEAQEPCGRAMRGWDGNHGDYLGWLISAAEEAGDLPLAFAGASQGVLEHPEEQEYLQAYARTAHALHRDAEALAFLRRHVTDYPDDVENAAFIAGELYGAGDLRLARTLYLRVLAARCPERELSCWDRGKLAAASLRLGLVEDAFGDLAAALEHDPACDGVLTEFRHYVSIRADSAVLLPRLRRLLDEVGARVAGGDPMQAGDFFSSIPDWPKAVHFYGIARDTMLARQRANLQPSRPDAFWRYGEALVAAGQYCAAVSVLTDARARTGYWNDVLASELAQARAACKEGVR